MKFPKMNKVNIVHAFSRNKGGATYSLGRQTDVILNEDQHAAFIEQNKHFVYNVKLAAVSAWTSTQLPEALMCYYDLKISAPRVSSQRTADGATRVQLNQIAIADSIPARHIDELATMINNCHHTMDNIKTCGVREISNVLHCIRAQSVNIGPGDKPIILVFLLYQTMQTQDTTLRNKRNILAWLQEIYQIPIVQSLVNEVPTLIEIGVGWISSLIHPQIKQEKQKLYVKINEIFEQEHQHPKTEEPRRQYQLPPAVEHQGELHQYELIPQQLHTVKMHG